MTSIAVVCGGRSLERDISLRSGHNVSSALRHLGHDATEVDIDEGLGEALAGHDAAFIALHGRDGEDGTVQLVAEALGVPYTGSSPLTCGFCFDKSMAKGLLRRAGLPVPDGMVVSAEAVRRMGAGAAMRAGADRLGFPLVTKPVAQGSALGLVVVDGPDDLSSAAMTAFNYGDRVLLERFVSGAEVCVGLWGDPLVALPPVEIRTESGVFDFTARVSPGAADFLCPAPLDAGMAEQARTVALEAAALLGVRDFGRVDMRIGDDGPVVLDVKTCPGMTESSLVPLAAAEAGTDFNAFVEGVLSAALARP